MRVLKSEFKPGQVRIGIVAARFNAFIVEQLLHGVEQGLLDHSVQPDQVDLVWVPGAFEIPLTAECMAAKGVYSAVIVLGAVIQGETPHFDFVAGECARGVTEVAIKHTCPVIFGVLTTHTVDQALARAAQDQGNKGHDLAQAALQMAGVVTSLAELE